jgi:hypothetical protein
VGLRYVYIHRFCCSMIITHVEMWWLLANLIDAFLLLLFCLASPGARAARLPNMWACPVGLLLGSILCTCHMYGNV